MGYNLEFRKGFSDTQYKNNLLKTSFMRSNSLKHFLSLENDISKQLGQKLKALKEKDEENYKEWCSSSLHQYFEDNVLNWQEDKVKSINRKHSTLSIPDFPWGNETKVIDIINKNIDGTTPVLCEIPTIDSQFSESKFSKAESHWAEFLFGSYWGLNKLVPKTDEEKKQITGLIVRRYRSIVNIIKNFPISQKWDINFSNRKWNSMFQDIISYEKISCYYRGAEANAQAQTLENEAIAKGFDSIYTIDGAFGRLKAIKFWRHLTWMDSMFVQTKLKRLLGFKINGSKSIESKC